MRVFAVLATACALSATPAHAARPFTIDDQLCVQDFGRVGFSPDGRWLVAEQYGPWKDAPTFDHEFLTHQTSSQIVVTDLAAGTPPHRLLDARTGAGDTFGAFSPDGGRILVFRQIGHRREMGVAVLATGAVTWSGLTVDPEVWSAQARWRNDHEIVVIVRAPDSPSILLGAGWQTQARTAAAWSAMGKGDYSGVALGAGRYANINPPPPAYSLAVFDLATGQSRTLATGAFFEIAVSPDGRTVAASQEAELVQPNAANAVVRFSSPFRRRRLVLINLDTGAATRPCPKCDLAPGAWAWSPDGKSFVAAARDRPEFDALYDYWRFDLRGGWSALAPALHVNLVVGGGIANLTGQVAWLGGAPVILAKPQGGQRPDWWRISGKAPINLTQAFDAPQGRALAIDRRGVLVSTGTGLVRLSPEGQARLVPLAATGWQSPRPLPGQAVERVFNPAGETPALLTPDGQTRPAGSAPSDSRFMDISAGGEVAAIAKDVQGVRTLNVYRPGAPPRALLTINARLSDVAFSRPVAITHKGVHGEALTSWLYLPTGHRVGEQRPLIIVPYAGERYDRPPSGFEPGATAPLTNVQLMVAKGYAVLVPSLPIGVAEDPSPGLAEAMLRIVDAAHDQYPEFSAERLAVWGHSFGGWTALMVGTQSPRFKALISSAPVSDLLTIHGNLRQASFAVPEVYMTLTGMQGWAEGGQARTGGPPWAVMDRYVRNSPLLHVDQITAPVLLIYGDMDYDPTQVAAVFMGLSRRGKDAQLLYYRGEGHVITNPGNLRDLHQRAFAFLADALGPPSPTLAAAPATASSSAIRASQ